MLVLLHLVVVQFLALVHLDIILGWVMSGMAEVHLSSYMRLFKGQCLAREPQPSFPLLSPYSKLNDASHLRVLAEL